MKTDELRECYLDFFTEKGCVRRPTDVLVPRADPTVLFTPAGMNQFKSQFLGIGKLDFTRAATCQKCLRTGDIQNVGVTAYHHTFFEMLGNFSFGDYFKTEAIHWAWEFLTDKKWLGLNPDWLSVTVFQDDEEAYKIWHDEIKLPTNRISRENEHENFWPAGAPSLGPDGVCGPCSEIFFHPNGGKTNVEIWNLVFTQFNRVGNPPDNLRPLPKKNIDTGMGLERTAAVLQGVESNFEIDSLRPLCSAAGELLGIRYSYDAPEGRALRRISDHVRAVAMCIHEGVQPGSEKESYVVRQLLRRASLEGYLLGKDSPFLHGLVSEVVNVMKTPYPELGESIQTIEEVIQEEESQFLSVIEKGLHKFDTFLEKAKQENSSTISGDDAFDLHQTDGFLIELTEALAAKNNLDIDRKQFNSLMEQHKVGSGSGAFADSVMAEGPLDALRKTSGETEFLGYDTDQASGKIVGIIAEKQLVEDLVEVGHSSPVAVVTEQTPFYGESGGQVGDTGTLKTDFCEFQVLDTQKDGGLTLHIGHLKQGKLSLGDPVTAEINTDKRAGIRRAHSATHLLHHALHKTIGEGALQRGSKVDQDEFRFDFSHRQALTTQELQQIEDEINVRIAESAGVKTEVMDLKDAKKLGAMALFGEKYPDRVRVVTMGDFSVEFCGGTHLTNTGQVGLCKIVNEEPVAKGIRRISALTGPKALQKIRDTENLLADLVKLLKTPQPEDLPRRITVLQDELKDSKRELAKYTSQSIASEAGDLLSSSEEINGVKIISHLADIPTRDGLREIIDQLKSKNIPFAAIVGAVFDGKVALTAAVSKDLVKSGLNASDCVKAAAKIVGGGGGGRPDLAEAGGRFEDKLDEALKVGAEFYKEKLNG